MFKNQIMIHSITANELNQYANIPISFEVNKIYQVKLENQGIRGIQLIEQECTPYIKNYDLNKEAHPSNWSKQFDLQNWGIFVAIYEDKYVGGAAVAPEISEEQNGMAFLWDLRIHPDYRSKGIGKMLLKTVKEWASLQDYAKLIVEKQNINVPACQFYSKNGFSLGTIDMYGYINSPVEHETKLIWYLDLDNKNEK